MEVNVLALKLETSDVKGKVELDGEYVGWADHRFLGIYFPAQK